MSQRAFARRLEAGVETEWTGDVRDVQQVVGAIVGGLAVVGGHRVTVEKDESVAEPVFVITAFRGDQRLMVMGITAAPDMHYEWKDPRDADATA